MSDRRLPIFRAPQGQCENLEANGQCGLRQPTPGSHLLGGRRYDGPFAMDPGTGDCNFGNEPAFQRLCRKYKRNS